VIHVKETAYEINQILKSLRENRKHETHATYDPCSDTKIKEENNYLCNDKMTHSMVLGCIYRRNEY